MAQNISLMGADYTSVPAVQLPKTGGGAALFFDPSGVTAVAADVASGKFFLDANGELKQGTASGGGGGSSFTLLGSAEFSVSTTSTTRTSVGEFSCGTAAATAAKIIYVRVRDKAGKRAGCFYGSDAFFINTNIANGSTSGYTLGGRITLRYSNSNKWGSDNTSSGYGVFPYSISSTGVVKIYSQYHSTYSLMINGTFKCEVYALDWPDGISPFT